MVDPQHPRHFSEEFKRQIVELYNAGKPVSKIMSEYDLGRSTVRRWITRINETGSSKAAGSRTPEQQRLLKLEKENKRLRRAAVLSASSPTLQGLDTARNALRS